MTAEPVYPLTISGTATDRDTWTVVPLTLRRTGEQDQDGLEVYEVEIPMPGFWMRSGRLSLHFDTVPGRSVINLHFTGGHE